MLPHRWTCATSPEGEEGEKRTAGTKQKIFQESRHFEAHGELRMFADGAVFVGARVVCAGGTTARVEWKSAFYPGPRYRRDEGTRDGVQMLALGFHEAFDLYLRRLRDAHADTIVARSAAGDASSLDPRGAMTPAVAHALREGMRRAGLLAAGPCL